MRTCQACLPSPYKRAQSDSSESLPLLGLAAHEESTGLAHLCMLGSPETVGLGISEGEDRKGVKCGAESAIPKQCPSSYLVRQKLVGKQKLLSIWCSLYPIKFIAYSSLSIL